MIWRNFFRELFHTTSRLISVIIITALAVAMSIGLTGISANGHRILDNYFESQNVADYWITGTRFDSRDIRKLSGIAGIEAVQPRVLMDVESRYDEDITLELFAVADYSINAPLVLHGRYPDNPREMMLSDVFAAANGLTLGDTFEMKLPSGDIIKKEVSALIKNPECLNNYNATNLTPNLGVYGFAYMDESALSDVLGKNVYNQICVKTAPGIDDAAFKRAVNGALGNKVLNVLALKDNSQVYSLIEQIDSIELILQVFPLLFFFVAVLIMFSTMSRLVENARMSIGTFKALGYSDRTILFYYLNSSALVVLLGFVLGALPATDLLTKLILDAFAHSMDMPPYELMPDTMYLIIAFGLTCLFCMGTALIVTTRALSEKPSECMRPKPPKKEKKVFLENFALVWRLMSFSQKYIVRNMMRNKTRMMICVVGITCCMTLSLCAFALNDSINYEVSLLGSNLFRYDLMISFEPDVERAQYEHIAKMAGVTDVQYDMMTSAKIYSSEKMETAAVTVEEDVLRLRLLERTSEWPLYMPKDGIIIKKELADKLGLSAGDTAHLKFPDKIEYYQVRIAEIKPAVDGILMSQSYWRALGRSYMPTSAYVTAKDAAALAQKLDDLDFVHSHKLKKETTDAVEEEIASLSLIVFVLIVFGGILALVVLYNLGVMSFYEQIRSLATLMVLGFYDRETRKLLLSENVAFAALGILLGLPLGVELANIILVSLATFHFNLWVQPLSYAAAAAITLGFALLVNILLGAMMRKIDMLGALKSVE